MLCCAQDGTSKMSKSAEADLSRINLLDDPKTILSKMKKAKTDAFEGLEFDNPARPEAKNLLTIYQLMTGYSKVRCIWKSLSQKGFQYWYICLVCCRL